MHGTQCNCCSHKPRLEPLSGLESGSTSLLNSDSNSDKCSDMWCSVNGAIDRDQGPNFSFCTMVCPVHNFKSTDDPSMNIKQ